MKITKKIAAWIMCLGIIAMLIPSTAHAATPQLRFSDPSTTVGATFEVTAKFSADSAVGSVEATLNYDTALLNFVSGTGATGGNGQVELSGDGNGTSEVSFSMQFQALAEGSTKIEIAAVTATSANGNSLQVTQGNSTVTIGPGDPSLIDNAAGAQEPSGSGVQVEVDGTQYTILSSFSDVLVPEGFTKTEMQYEGQNCQAVMQESSGTYALYLASAAGEENFFLYNSENGKFSPFEQISIAQDKYIILLNDDQSKSLPDKFQKTTITVNGKDFPSWQNVDSSEYYLVYALNTDGKKSFYQYDTTDGTYQRYVVEKTEEKETTSSDSFLGKIQDFIKDHMNIFLLVVWGGFLIFIILIIVLGIKLHHRNDELDDLYEEYGIDDEDDEDDEEEIRRPVKKKQEKSKVREKPEQRPQKKKRDEDDFYDFEDEDEEYDKIRKDYHADEEEDEFAAYEDMSLDDLNFEDGEIDDLDELLDARVRKSDRPAKPVKKKRSHAEDDDTFKMDFIDLD